MAEINLLTQLYNDFITVLQQTVIKYSVLAEQNETVDTKREADAYVTAFLMKDSFNTYLRYDKEIIATVLGLDIGTDRDIIEEYHLDNSKIPFELRETFLLKQREKIINEYVERNNYYRMLNGLPDCEDTEDDFIYVDEDFAIRYDIDPTVPVHLLEEDSISIIDSLGYLDTLKEKYPEKKYLRFLGTNSIDIVQARTAKNFAVLRIPYSVSTALWNKFALIYDQCREYFMSCIYIKEYRDTMDYYDNFIALCIMVMTIQQVIARVIKDTVERNFFDDYCVRTLFSVYGVPYYTYMDSGTKQQIVQDLNILVLNKGTNKVLYDIASILGYDRLKIYKYYLMKAQKFDSNGVPLSYMKEDSETGELVPDYEQIFDIYFQKVELSDVDTYKSLLNPSGRVSYEDITQDDPFWVEDNALIKEIYESEYNFVETKYLGIGISYRLSKILFENVYLIKMLFEKKNEIAGITLYLPKVSFFAEVSLFDSLVALCAMVCKQNHLKGEILTRPSAILHVMGFNFERDFKLIREEILANPYLDNSLTKFLMNSHTYTVEGINTLYRNIEELYETIVDTMSTTQNIEVYDAYRKLYETLYYTNENQTMFKIGVDEQGNPIYAKTFLEYLQYENPELYDLINMTESDKFTEYINHICQKIMQIVPELKYFGFLAGRSETMEEMLVGLIRFFKSYTTDMIGLDIIYILDMKPELLLKLVDHLAIKKTIQSNDEFLLSHSDHLEFTSTVRYGSDLMLRDEIFHIITFYKLFDSFILNDALHHLLVNLHLPEDKNSHFFDWIEQIMSQAIVDERLFMTDAIKCYSELNCRDRLSFADYIKSIIVSTTLNSELGFVDIMYLVRTQNEFHDCQFFNDAYKLYITHQLDSKLAFHDMVKILIHAQAEENIPMMDILSIVKTSIIPEELRLNDHVEWSTTRHTNSSITFTNKVTGISKIFSVRDTQNTLFDLIHMIVQLPVCENFCLRDSCTISYSD